MGLVMTLIVSVAATTNASALYILTGLDDSAIILDKRITKQTPQITNHLVCITSKGREYDVTLTAGQTVTIRQGETVTSMVARKETVSNLLARAQIKPAPLEMVGVDVSDSAVTLTISDQITFYDEIREGDAWLKVYAKPLDSGEIAYGVFNIGETEMSYRLAPEQATKLRDLWAKEDLGCASVSLTLEPHSCRLIRG